MQFPRIVLQRIPRTRTPHQSTRMPESGYKAKPRQRKVKKSSQNTVAGCKADRAAADQGENFDGPQAVPAELTVYLHWC